MKFVRAGTVPLHETLRLLSWFKYPTKKDIVILAGKEVHVDSVRYRLFVKKGVLCAECGLEGNLLAVEKDKNQPGNEKDRHHLNLYHLRDDGSEVMITASRISIDRGRTLDNLEPLCDACRVRKEHENRGHT